MKHIEYEKELQNAIQTCRIKNIKIKIFGASKLGWFICKVLEFHGIKVDSYIDSKAKEKSFEFNGKKIYLAENSKPTKNINVIVAIFNDNIRKKVENTLDNQGYEILKNNPFIYLYSFYINIAKRKVDKKKFAISIDNLNKLYSIGKYSYGFIYENFYSSPLVTANVTQKCNLKCIDCGQAIPYYKNPKEFSTLSIINEIKAFCTQVDLVPEISLHGGEPFLNPFIGDIALELSKIPNLIFINIVTNGSILPKEDVWKKLFKAGVDMHQSNYDTISKKRDPVFDLCHQNKIFCDTDYVFEHNKWLRINVKDYKRSNHENDKIYKNCVETSICAQIMDGKLYRCPISAHWGAQGHFNQIEGKDYIYLDDRRKEKKDSVIKFLENKKAITACNYCNYHPLSGAKLVRPAIQLSGKNRYRMEKGLDPI